MEKKTVTYYYCLLCAQLKCISKIIQLQVDEEVFRKTVEKLSRLNILFDFYEKFPKTVCESCNDNLDRSFEFVAGVEKAQHILNYLYKNQINTEKKSKEQNQINTEKKSEDKNQINTGKKTEKQNHINTGKKSEEQTQINTEKKSEEKNQINTGKKTEKQNEINTGKKSEKQNQINTGKKSEKQNQINTGKNLEKQNQINTEKKSDEQNNINTEKNSEEQKCDSLIESNDTSDCNVSLNFEINSQFSDLTDTDTESSDISEGNSNVSCESPRNNKVKKSNSDITSLKYQKTWNDYPWTCSICETQFTTTEELKIHTMKYHQWCNALKCNDCGIRKLHFKRLIIHIQRHRRHLKLLCYKCNSKFLSTLKLNAHMRKEHGSKTNYVCQGCNADFDSSEELHEHTQTFYKGKKWIHVPVELQCNSLSCIICKKSFKSKKLLDSHLLIHTDRKKEHTCEKCGKCFFLKRQLTMHMHMHSDIRPLQCKICKCTFKTLRQLKLHIPIHDGEKPHICDQCEKGFRLKSQLNSHKIIHTNSLPYECSYCDKKFRFKSILNQHIRQHTGLKPYSCEICARDFTNWPNYNKHMKRRHDMDKSKKKRTAEGVYPINPSTGKIIKHQDANETLEWKNQILKRRVKGRQTPRKKLQINVVDGTDNDKLGTK